jgi:Tfp pilus assembly protein PilN
MKAVNLIPAEERRGAAGRTGGSIYGLLGALAALAVLASAYGLTSRSISQTRADIATTRSQADAAEAVTGDLSAYTKFNQLRQQRKQTVAKLAAARFDWAHVLREVARTIPADASLTTLSGKVAGAHGAAAPAPGGAASGGSSSPAGPSVEVAGCTTGQSAVARLMVDLRRIDGVQRVQLTSSAKAAGASASTGANPATGTSCGSDGAQFAMTIHFRAPASGAAQATPATTPGSTP